MDINLYILCKFWVIARVQKTRTGFFTGFSFCEQYNLSKYNDFTYFVANNKKIRLRLPTPPIFCVGFLMVVVEKLLQQPYNDIIFRSWYIDDFYCKFYHDIISVLTWYRKALDQTLWSKNLNKYLNIDFFKTYDFEWSLT